MPASLWQGAASPAHAAPPSRFPSRARAAQNTRNSFYIMGCSPFFDTTGGGSSSPIWNLPLDFPHKRGYTTNYIGISLPHFLYYAAYVPKAAQIRRKTGGNNCKNCMAVYGGALPLPRRSPDRSPMRQGRGPRGAKRFPFRNRRCVVPGRGTLWKIVETENRVNTSASADWPIGDGRSRSAVRIHAPGKEVWPFYEFLTD